MRVVQLRFLSLLIILLICIQLSASTKKDSTNTQKVDSSVVNYYRLSFDSLFLGSTHIVDTSIFIVTDFDEIQRSKLNFASLSNIGAPHKSIVLINPFYGGYNLENNTFPQIMRNYKHIRYLTPVQPFSEIYYTTGANKEQQMEVSFARQLFPRFTIGMEFALNSSPGIYKNTKSENARVYFTGRYHTKDERYAVAGNYYHNKIWLQENGGIKNDSVFENNIEPDRRLISVNLLDAGNLIKESGFGFEQYFNFVKSNVKVNDSTYKPRKFQFGRVTHQFSYHRNQTIYSENSPLVDFYKTSDAVLDSNSTYDSIYQSSFKNRLYLSSLGYKKFQNDIPFFIYAGIEHVYILQSDSLKKTTYNQFNPFGGIRISLFHSSYLDGKITMITGVYGSGDLEFDAGIKQFLGTEGRNLGNIFFRINIVNQSPSWMFERYQSNHFRWENTFDNSKFITFNGGYSIKGITIGGRWQVIDKYIYFNKLAHPEQSTGTTSLKHLYTEFHIRPGKFEVRGSFDFQDVNNTDIIHVPTFSGKLKFAFAQDLFSNAATIKPGFSINWFSSYYADAYMPALRSFYLQNEKKIGNFPFIDVFLTLKVKRASLFIEYANVYALFGHYQYYTTLHYPTRDARFYFGVKWRFFK